MTNWTSVVNNYRCFRFHAWFLSFFLFLILGSSHPVLALPLGPNPRYCTFRISGRGNIIRPVYYMCMHWQPASTTCHAKISGTKVMIDVDDFKGRLKIGAFFTWKRVIHWVSIWQSFPQAIIRSLISFTMFTFFTLLTPTLTLCEMHIQWSLQNFKID